MAGNKKASRQGRPRNHPYSRYPKKRKSPSKYSPVKHFVSTPQHSLYTKFIDSFFSSIKSTHLSDIESAIKQSASYPCITLHPYILIALPLKLALIVSWLLWVEANCTCREIDKRGKGELFCAKYPDGMYLTGLGRLAMYDGIKKLREIGAIETKRVGLPAMQHFRIDHAHLYSIILEAILSEESVIPDALDSSEWTRGV